MSASDARAFLLAPKSYSSLDLPKYFDFRRVISATRRILAGKSFAGFAKTRPSEHDDVNHKVLSNKDGRHAWRPFELIHPALYVSLVNDLTVAPHWKLIRDRFADLQKDRRIQCLSIPSKAPANRKPAETQILGWWQQIEQRSIELALKYNGLFHADITDCYGAIYTHSIAWAIHGKPAAKQQRKDNALLGNIVDRHIQGMRHGQTNGIPQGSVLMDLIAELVLGYADLELSKRLANLQLQEWQILRYRDDYRIFTQTPQDGEAILKALTEVMIGLGLKLSAAKTTGAQHIVNASLKADKRHWIGAKQYDRNPQKHLLIIHAHGSGFPNSGSLVTALGKFYSRLAKASRADNPRVLISIAMDIAHTSPRAFPQCAAIISKLLNQLGEAEQREVVNAIQQKLCQWPNTAHMELWLQRICHRFAPHLAYVEPLCAVVQGKQKSIWNSDWISSPKLKAAADPAKIVNKKALRELPRVVKPAEVLLWADAY